MVLLDFTDDFYQANSTSDLSTRREKREYISK